MKSLRLLLTTEQKDKIREIARKNYLKYNNETVAIRKTEKEIINSGIVSGLLNRIAIGLGVALIMYWVKNYISFPATIYNKEEPR